ncbi:hypothetical protein [Chryseolinea lacunae]|uniref:Addiction module toxin RelE n=1 Tax=Chryseolinea lacunae TaxID=2801331 RepID=A0ABS1KXJ8_9BACT|nr:hypothetical protein [Chryseolinea lacunae]MBL0744129.1 hypothetical protein [Chryseolinea lacunae]
MTIFTLARITEFDSTVQEVYKLIRNGKCLLDSFVEEIENTNLEGEIGTIYQIIEDVASGKPHPRCKKLRLGKIKVQAYEAKSKHLRTYFFHENRTGQVIVIGGKKKDQTTDLVRLKEHQQ